MKGKYKMNYDKLKIGMVFRSYKSLARYLGDKEKNGDSKTAQLGKWSQQFTWEQKRNSWIIENVHINPYAEVDNMTTMAITSILILKLLKDRIKERLGHPIIIMPKDIDALDINMITNIPGIKSRRDKNDITGPVVIPVLKKELLLELGLINKKFVYYIKEQDSLFKDFRSDVKSISSNILLSSLGALDDRKILHTSYSYNIIENGKDRIANLYRIVEINAILNRTLVKFNCRTRYDVRLKNLIIPFYKCLEEEMFRELNITFFEEIYLIATNLELLEIELKVLVPAFIKFISLGQVSNERQIKRVYAHFAASYKRYLIRRRDEDEPLTFDTRKSNYPLMTLPDNYIERNNKLTNNYVKIKDRKSIR